MHKRLELYVNHDGAVLIEVDGMRRVERGRDMPLTLQTRAAYILRHENGFTEELRVIDPTRQFCRAGEMKVSLDQLEHWLGNDGAAPRLRSEGYGADSRADEARRAMGLHW